MILHAIFFYPFARAWRRSAAKLLASCSLWNESHTKFELIGSGGLFSGLLRLRYGAGHDDPLPFILTLTPQYAAREIRRTPPVSFLKIQRYAERNADKLKAIAIFEKEAWVQHAYLE
jgi:hypothetical protein